MVGAHVWNLIAAPEAMLATTSLSLPSRLMEPPDCHFHTCIKVAADAVVAFSSFIRVFVFCKKKKAHTDTHTHAYMYIAALPSNSKTPSAKQKEWWKEGGKKRWTSRRERN